MIQPNKLLPTTGKMKYLPKAMKMPEIAKMTKAMALAQWADRLARPFLLVVLALAGASAVYGWSANPEQALMVAVSVLIVTCPCALSLATPAAMLASGIILITGLRLMRPSMRELLDATAPDLAERVLGEGEALDTEGVAHFLEHECSGDDDVGGFVPRKLVTGDGVLIRKEQTGLGISIRLLRW